MSTVEGLENRLTGEEAVTAQCGGVEALVAARDCLRRDTERRP
ncbi:hypothetical protein ACFWY9_24110 [Amycolatopsis sp. NPDC059027]